MEKTLPNNIEAECGVLGSIIIDPEALMLVADTLAPEDFYRDAHRTLYGAIIHLYQHREPPDFITICDELGRRNQLDEVGGASYITSLISHVPTSGNIEHYASIVAKDAVYRRLIHAAGKIAAQAFERESDALLQAEEMIFQISKKAATTDFVGGEEIIASLIDKLEKLQARRGSLAGLPTGFYSLDHMTGGLQFSDLIILAARPGMGKTSLALALAYHTALVEGKRVAIFSLEMSKEQLMKRLLSMDTGINGQRLSHGQFEDDEWEQVIASGDRLSTDLLQIDDTAGLSISALRSKARRLQAEKGVDLIIVDYLQLMQAHTNGKRVEPRIQELAEISSGLKAVAKELNVPVVALAQLSRAVESRTVKIPMLSDLRESGSIENDADIVGFIYRDDYYAGFDELGQSKSTRPGEADLIIEKHRNGPVGEISLYWDAPRTRFFNSQEEMQQTYAK